MYSFRQIRDAIRNVSARGGASAGFPYGEKTDELLHRVRQAPHLQPLIEEIRAEARRACEVEPEPLSFSRFRQFEAAGTRKEYENPYFDRRRRLLGLALATVIDETDEYVEALQNLIWDICGEYSWALPAHQPVGVEAVKANRVPPDEVVDLFAAETAHTLAETLVLVGDWLNPWMEHRIRSEIERRIFRPVFHMPTHFWWESASMNWASVCAGGVGMAALLLERDEERLAGMIERVIRSMECFLEGYGEDGGCAEGIGYWIYGFGYYTYFADMLDVYTSGSLNLLQGTKVKRIAGFPVGVSLAAERFVSFSDAAERSQLTSGLVSRLVRRFELDAPELLSVSSFHSDHCYRWPHVTRNLFWSDESLLGKPTPEGSYYFEELEWLVDRRRAGTSFVGFAAKGGHNDEPHNHNDLGSFIVFAGGESLLCDLGAGVYTRDYFGAKRYTYLHNASEGHSVALIDGNPQLPGHERRARVLEYSTDRADVRFSLDLTEAYGLEKLRLYERRFAWANDEKEQAAVLRLDDRFEFSKAPGALEEIFISRHEPNIGEGRVAWRGQAGVVTLEYDADAWLAGVDVLDTHNHSVQPERVYRLRLQAREPADAIQFTARFIVKSE